MLGLRSGRGKRALSPGSLHGTSKQIYERLVQGLWGAGGGLGDVAASHTQER